jgi:hypothetical protein
MTDDVPGAPVADTSRAPVPQRPTPTIRITALKDLDELSARHFVEAYLPTHGRILWVLVGVGAVMSVGAILSMSIDTPLGYGALAFGGLVGGSGFAVRALRIVRAAKAGLAAGIAFPLGLQVDAIVAKLRREGRVVDVDSVTALLMHKARTFPTSAPVTPQFSKGWSAAIILACVLAMPVGVIALLSRESNDTSAPAHAEKCRPHWQSLNAEQQRELATTWVMRGLCVHLADACERSNMVDAAARLRALPHPQRAEDLEEISSTLSMVSQEAMRRRDVSLGSAAVGFIDDIETITKSSFSEQDLFDVSFSVVTSARLCGTGEQEEQWQLEDVKQSVATDPRGP